MAREQFVVSVSVTAPQLVRVAARYDGYASALVGYAVVLDRVQPKLVWLHRQLVTGVAEQDAVAMRPLVAGRPVLTVDPSDDARLRSWAAEFEGLWREWDRALRWCRHGLGEAGRVEADRHGWSALGHGLSHVLGSVVDPVAGFLARPDLAGLSDALGSLASDLTVLGVVLLVVFPPAAGVLT